MFWTWALLRGVQLWDSRLQSSSLLQTTACLILGVRRQQRPGDKNTSVTCRDVQMTATRIPPYLCHHIVQICLFICAPSSINGYPGGRNCNLREKHSIPNRQLGLYTPQGSEKGSAPLSLSINVLFIQFCSVLLSGQTIANRNSATETAYSDW